MNTTESTALLSDIAPAPVVVEDAYAQQIDRLTVAAAAFLAAEFRKPCDASARLVSQ